jgi:hypothetical protein
MQQLVVMRPYIEKHLHELHERIQDETLIMKHHKLHFTAWLKDLNIPVGETPEEKMIYLLVAGPHSAVKALFVFGSQLAFPAEKLRNQKQKQTTNFSTGFWNAEK